ncbi:MAG: S8 family serine peptidase, partial [Oscillospiraceae bacterium]
MKIRRIISLFMAILLCGTWGGALQPSMAAELPKTDGYVFKLSETAPIMLSAENSLSGIAPVAYAEGYFTVDTLAELQPLIDAGLVEYAVPNAKLSLFAEPATNDPGLAQQWYADSLGISSAWNQGLKGTGVKVALVDSGIYKTHEDLQGATIDGKNFLGGGNYPDNWGDTLGHGTLVAGLLAAKANNGKGVAGLTDHASILALRCFAPKESGSMDSGSGDVSVIMEALGYAISQNVDVINMSFGGSDAELLKPIEEQLKKAADKGILLVAAAGNDGNRALQYPAAFNCVTGVGNVNSAGTVASTSQRNSSVFVTAPGTNIYGLGYNADAPYRTDSGTSFSSPIVASLATIAKQADKGINNDGFRDLLKECATDKG